MRLQNQVDEVKTLDVAMKNQAKNEIGLVITKGL